MSKQNGRWALPARRTRTVDEVAAIAGVHRKTIYEAIAKGDIEAVRLGRRIVVPDVVVERLFPSQGGRFSKVGR